jgi:hypothetical protein
MGVNILGEEGKNLIVVETYRWILVVPPRAGVLRVYVMLKFTNSLLDLVEVEVLVEKAGTPTKAGSVRAQFDDPGEYIDFVLDILEQLFSMFEVSEEHYEQHTYL